MFAGDEEVIARFKDFCVTRFHWQQYDMEEVGRFTGAVLHLWRDFLSRRGTGALPEYLMEQLVTLGGEALRRDEEEAEDPRTDGNEEVGDGKRDVHEVTGGEEAREGLVGLESYAVQALVRLSRS